MLLQASLWSSEQKHFHGYPSSFCAVSFTKSDLLVMSIKLQSCCGVFLKEKSRPHPTAAAHCVVVLATHHRQPLECVFVSVASWPVLKARHSKEMHCGPRNNKRSCTAQTVAQVSGWVLQCLVPCTAWRILQTRKILVMKKMFPPHHHIFDICLSPGVS